MLTKEFAQCRKLADLRVPFSLLLTVVGLLSFLSSSWVQASKPVEISNGADLIPVPVDNASTDTVIEKLLQTYAYNGSSQLFDGTFVYLFEDQVKTIKVNRTIDDKGQIVEKFVPLDGSKMNNTRILQNQYCQLENGWQFQFHAMSSSFPFRVNNYFQQLKQNYDFSLVDSALPEEETVAGNQVVQIIIQAKDPLRYGYQLWFEPTTSTLLKYKLVNQKGKAVEQYLFTEFNLKEQTDSHVQSSQVNFPKNIQNCLQQFSGLGTAFDQYFNGQKIPEGYEAISFRKSYINNSERMARQFQLSDGLALVSVFIEDVDKTGKAIDGVVKLGPMSVAGKTIGRHQATVLGAIPIDSALQILDAVRP